MKALKDNFSRQSAQYKKFRPTYPIELIESLCLHAPSTDLAWDCATGNGQVAIQLSTKFNKVIATDISNAQIQKAPKKENIVYKIERSEDSSLETDSVDLLTVAQAIHWFDFEPFYAEAKRVLKKTGVIAIVGYSLFTTKNSKLDKLIRYFYKDIVGSYWDMERKYIDSGYATIPFPFEEFYLPQFEMKHRWSAEQLLGYLGSWSAVAHYWNATGTDPVNLIKDPLEKILDGKKKVEVRFEIIARYGKL